MALNVAFLSDAEIEEAAQDLQSSYSRYHRITKTSFDLEEYLPYLGLSCDFDDLPKLFGIPDVIGALTVETRSVYIDEHLDPVDHPTAEGRYRFTLSHELGHWCLHRKVLPSRSKVREPSIICTPRLASEPIEVQANKFAVGLLMPRHLVFKEWETEYGCEFLTVEHAFKSLALSHISLALTTEEEDDAYLNWVSAPLARRFQVSKVAMRIRLERLGLLRRPPKIESPEFSKLPNQKHGGLLSAGQILLGQA